MSPAFGSWTGFLDALPLVSHVLCQRIESQHAHRKHCYALITLLIAGHRWNIFVKIPSPELLRGRSDGGFEQCTIAERRIAALVLGRNGMQRQDVIDQQKSRRWIHLPSLRINSPCFPKTSRTWRSRRAGSRPG